MHDSRIRCEWESDQKRWNATDGLPCGELAWFCGHFKLCLCYKEIYNVYYFILHITISYQQQQQNNIGSIDLIGSALVSLYHYYNNLIQNHI